MKKKNKQKRQVDSQFRNTEKIMFSKYDDVIWINKNERRNLSFTKPNELKIPSSYAQLNFDEEKCVKMKICDQHLGFKKILKYFSIFY